MFSDVFGLPYRLASLLIIGYHYQARPLILLKCHLSGNGMAAIVSGEGISY